MAAFTSSAPQLASPDIDGLVGEIKIWPSEALPNGKWRYCDGALLSRANYSLLFARIGDAWGAGDGTTTFAVPNLSGKFPVGVNPADTDFDGVGDMGGSKTTSVSITISGTTGGDSGSVTAQSGTGSNPSSSPHIHNFSGSDTDNPSIVPPYAVVRFIIKVI